MAELSRYEKIEQMKDVSLLTIDGNLYKVKIVGCEPEVGITVIEKAIPSHILMCQLGPSSPQWKNIPKYRQDIKESVATFDFIVDQIEQSKLIDIKAVVAFREKAFDTGALPTAVITSNFCAFAS